MIAIGEIALWVALLMAACATLACFVGGVQQRPAVVRTGQRALVIAGASALAAMVGLWVALFRQDFSLVYVASHVSLNLPELYRLSALWAGPSGRLLLCAVVLSCYALVFMVAHRAPRRIIPPGSTTTLSAVVFIVLLSLVITDDPYRRMESVVPDGRSVAPWVQSMGMVLHPPVFYLGLMATVLPFAVLIGALTSGRRDAETLRTMQRWAAWSWAMQTLALGLGMWWTYTALGTAQLWRSTHAEYASIVPWVLNAALVVGLSQSANRHALRVWHGVLTVATCVTAIGSVLLLRDVEQLTVANVIQTPLGHWMLWSLTGATVIAVYLASVRWNVVHDTRIEADHTASSAASGATRLPRSIRQGATVALVGVTVFATAVIAGRFQRDVVTTVTTGETFTARDAYGASWTFASQGISTFVEPNHHVAALALMATRAGRRIGLVASEKRQFVDVRGEPTFDPSTQAGILSRPLQDLYVVLGEARDNNTATVRIAFLPLASWVWLGVLLMAAGSIMMMWPPSAAALGANSAPAAHPYPSARTAMTSNEPLVLAPSLDPVEAAIAKARAAQRECATCGPRPEPQADYCSTCGRFLAGTCPSCGTRVGESGARFCSACGDQLVRN